MSEILHIPIDQELDERARWLVTFRWLVLTAAVVCVLLANHWLGNVLPVRPLWFTLAGIGLYNGVLWLVARAFQRRRRPHRCYVALMHFQILTDLLALTILLHFSGGVENPVSPYYTLIVLVGSLLMTRRDSYIYAVVASLLWIALLVAEGSGAIPHYNLAGFRLAIRHQQVSHIVAESFVLLSANLACAYLASDLIERLRHGEQQLLEASTSCELRAAELAQLNRRLRELDQTRAAFIRLVTHELRAPVAAIQSYLRLILDGYVPKERTEEIIGKAEARANDQLELIGDLLDLARVQDPAPQAEVVPCDAAALLRDVMDMMQARIQDKSLTAEVEVAPELPRVAANEEHVRQIWINLVSNAIKYTPEGGRIAIRLECKDGRVCGAVQDTGIGIRPEDIERIFETFYRTEAAKAMSVRGTGLGLSIVRGIIERYGGRLWVTSTVGEGSVFCFELPAADLSDAPSAEPEAT
ncbi:MAG: hypothetical protein JXA74_00765 [Anaerolineae bacterium]|nr:hypothetical protein [Anaerolineae bacterium]